MTNTKFRKRALLSSVAMLLVALVALGSATFAWFTNNPIAEAKGITGKGETSTGLVIYTDTDKTVSHSAKFMNSTAVTGDLTLLPAWLKDSSTALQTKAKSSDSYAHDPDDNTVTWTPVDIVDASSYVPAEGSTEATLVNLSSGGVYKESAYLNTTGLGAGNKADVKLTGLKIKATTDADRAIKSGLCVAVYVGTERKAIFKVGSSEAIKNYATAPVSGHAVGAESGTIAVTANETGLDTAIGQAGDAAADVLKVTFIVYLDGTDPNVKTDYARAATLINSIEASFATVTV